MRVLAKINKNDPKKCLLSTFSQHLVDNKFHCFLFSQLFSPFVFVGLSNSSKGKCSSLKTGKCDLTPQKWAWGSSSGNSIRDAFFPCNCKQQLAFKPAAPPCLRLQPACSSAGMGAGGSLRGRRARGQRHSTAISSAILIFSSNPKLLCWLGPRSLVSVLYTGDFFFYLGVDAAT